MSSDSQERADSRIKMLRAVATDAQFWVPTIVLIGGLILLRWIS